MKYELLLILKQRSTLLLMVMSLLLTSLSLLNGWHNIAHMRAQIAHAKEEAHERHLQKLAGFKQQGEVVAGELGYYEFHNVYQEPSEWSFIALGNQLVTPYIQRVRLLGLQGQIYDGESHHPEYVMLGAFDYAFWLVFFLPLLCITLMHDVKASEFQAKRLNFLGSLVTNPWHFWLRRLSIRWALVIMVFIVPLITFALWHELTSLKLFQIIGITLIYSFIWTALAAGVSLRKRALNANTNAMLLTIVWLLLCVGMPNVFQLWLHRHYPVQEGSQIALKHRQLVHNAWDQPKNDTMAPFYNIYPQWQHTAPVIERFHWKWYFAFQHMADVKLDRLVKAREAALMQRDKVTGLLSLGMPSLWVQRELEGIAQSNLTHLLRHRSQIFDFHTSLRHTLYPYIFEERFITETDFQRLPIFE